MGLLLASRSPRRAALLTDAGIAFEPGRAPDVDETPPPGVTPPEAARLLAERKVRAVAPHTPGRVVLCADTLVFLGETILGKPADAEDARRMLGVLSGRRHAVATGVAVSQGGVVRSGVDVTRVQFRGLAPAQIAAYVRTGEPLDKAGAYGLQGGGAALVASVDGARDTVIGLPIALVRKLLSSLADLGFGSDACPADR